MRMEEENLFARHVLLNITRSWWCRNLLLGWLDTNVFFFGHHINILMKIRKVTRDLVNMKILFIDGFFECFLDSML